MLLSAGIWSIGLKPIERGRWKACGITTHHVSMKGLAPQAIPPPQFEAHIVQDRVGEIRLAAGFGWLGFAFERLYVAGKDSSDVT